MLSQRIWSPPRPGNGPTEADLTQVGATTHYANPLRSAPRAVTGTSAVEFQPAIQWGGRSVAVDVSPINAQTAIAASESGGLFRTVDGGVTWRHLDALPVWRMGDVKYAPGNPNVVIATSANPDTHRVNQGGIWRSTDGGTLWHRPASGDPPCARADRATWGISFVPGTRRVFVATECGVEISDDLGATWAPKHLDQPVYAIQAQSGGVVDVCGAFGHQRSTDGGTTFGPIHPIAGFGCQRAAEHALAASPVEGDVLFAALGDRLLFESDDAGRHWTNLNPPGGVSRPPWVAVNRSVDGQPGHIDVYYGNGLITVRRTCTATGPALRCGGSWDEVAVDHVDQNGLAFTTAPGSRCALYVVSDGGVHKSTDCGASFHIVGSSSNGYSALQIYEVDGQVHPDHLDLYLGTQDNEIWASSDGGVTWPSSTCCEGFFFQMRHSTPSHSNQVITGVACAACVNLAWDAHLENERYWNDPPAPPGLPGPVATPFLVAPSTYVQWQATSAAGNGSQLWLTRDAGATWSRVLGAVLTRPRIERPYLGGINGSDPVLYQPIRRADGSIGVIKVAHFLTGTASVGTAGSGLGSVDQSCDGEGGFLCPAAFGVDPNDARHLIAVDRAAATMKQSFDGGLSWTTDTELTDVVTLHGELNPYSQVHAISFDPTNGDRIFIGTEAGGITVSQDGGVTWQHLSGTEVIPAITSFVVDEVRQEVFVSTYGRGLWRL